MQFRSLCLSVLALVTPGFCFQIDCGEICTEFIYESEELSICSSKNKAQIWNTTDGTCVAYFTDDFKIVSYTQLILTLGVSIAVRRPIGRDCWDFSPENVAMSVIESGKFNSRAHCRTTTYNSGSMMWEVAHYMNVFGYEDCEDIVILHNNYHQGCEMHDKDARTWATIAYFLGILIGLLGCFACVSCCCLGFLDL